MLPAHVLWLGVICMDVVMDLLLLPYPPPPHTHTHRRFLTPPPHTQTLPYPPPHTHTHTHTQTCFTHSLSSTLLASLSSTILQRKDVVNQCLEFVSLPYPPPPPPPPPSNEQKTARRFCCTLISLTSMYYI